MEATPVTKKRVKRQHRHDAPVHAVVILRIEVHDVVAKSTKASAPAPKPRKSSRSKQESVPTFTYTPHQKKLLAEIENDEVGDFVEDPPRENA